MPDRDCAWVTPDEARRRLHISRATIYRLLRAGKLPATRFGRQLRIPLECITPKALP